MLDVPTLVNAYEKVVLLWLNEGETNLWWRHDQRMVLNTDRFRLHRSLRRTLARFR
ncbi:MAG: leucyl/phenylalanyl-tRNA--protein transferase, partial [Ottowia sp.]|nr:leucyl/phenylalanyl-tRNA--protein transferase [Ottowia sp.]